MADTKLLEMLDRCIQRLEAEGYSCKAERDALRDYSNSPTPPADAALADDALIELVTDYAQSKVRAESCRYRYESAEYYKEAAETLEQIRAALRARQPAQAVADGFVVIPAAWFDREIPRIDAGGANPITPDEHCCEFVLYQERERIHLALSALLAASKGGQRE